MRAKPEECAQTALITCVCSEYSGNSMGRTFAIDFCDLLYGRFNCRYSEACLPQQFINEWAASSEHSLLTVLHGEMNQFVYCQKYIFWPIFYGFSHTKAIRICKLECRSRVEDKSETGFQFLLPCQGIQKGKVIGRVETFRRVGWKTSIWTKHSSGLKSCIKKQTE